MNEDSPGAISVDEAADMVMRNSQEQPGPEEAKDQTEDEVEVDEEVTDEVEVDEADTEDDDQPEDDDDADEVEEDDDAELFYEVDGEEVSASQLKEWKENGLFQKDYTQKTQALSEQRKALEREVQTTQQLQAQLQDALATFAIDTEPAPDWAKLNAELDPKEFNQLQLDYHSRQAQKQKAKEAYQALQHHSQQEVVAREKAAILEHFPQWADPKEFEAVAPKMVEYAGKLGFSAEEFAGITDHRMYRVLDRLVQLEAQMAEVGDTANAISKRVVKAKPKLSPGSKPAKNQASNKERRIKRDRLRKTGSVDDAVNYLIG